MLRVFRFSRSLTVLSLIGASASYAAQDVAGAKQAAPGAVLGPVSRAVPGPVAGAVPVGLSVAPPIGFDEGVDVRLSPEQMGEVLPWASNSQIALKDLLETSSELAPALAKDLMIRGIRDIVLASAPNRAETLMRFVLNRALKLVEIVETGSAPSQAGVLDQELRLLRRSVEMALKYYQSDVEFLNGIVQRRKDPVALPYAQFGVDYAEFLMNLNQSVFDASVQYEVGRIALGLLQWDLYRDANRLAFAPAIAKLEQSLKTTPERAPALDSESVAWVRQLNKAYAQARSLLTGVQLNPPSQPPREPEPSTGGEWVGGDASSVLVSYHQFEAEMLAARDEYGQASGGSWEEQRADKKMRKAGSAMIAILSRDDARVLEGLTAAVLDSEAQAADNGVSKYSGYVEGVYHQCRNILYSALLRVIPRNLRGTEAIEVIEAQVVKYFDIYRLASGGSARESIYRQVTQIGVRRAIEVLEFLFRSLDSSQVENLARKYDRLYRQASRGSMLENYYKAARDLATRELNRRGD